MSVIEDVRMLQMNSVLRDYAERRGLKISAGEVEQALLQAGGKTVEQQIIAAWRWMFPRERLVSLRLVEAERQHFPALRYDNALGLVIITERPEKPENDSILVPQTESIVMKEDGPSALTAKPIRPARRAIMTVLKAHRTLFIRAGIATVFINLLAVVGSLFAMQVYDRVVPNFSYPTLWALAIGVLIAILFDLLFKNLRLALLERLALRADEALSQFFFEKVIALKLDRRPSRVGTLVSQVRDYESIKGFFTSTTLYALADLPFCLFFIAVIAMLGGYVAIVPLVLVLVCLCIGLSVQRPLARLQKQQTDESAQRQGLLIEALSGAENLKAQGGEWRSSLLWQQLTRQLGVCGERIRTLGSRAQYFAASCQQLAYALVLVVGVYQIEAGLLTMGGLIACSILAGRAMNNISQITSVLVQWQHARYALEILDKLLELPSDDSAQRHASTVVLPHQITLRDIQYSYDGMNGTQMMVENLRIEPGERLIVLGRNGSGKSTLLRLIAGLATPNMGTACIAGLDLQGCRLGWLRETVGYLPQDVRLFGGTLRDNLTLGLGTLDEASLQDALAKTGLDSFVRSQEQGLDCLIREGGAGLSGGQRQLIGLTRLVLQRPAIWLLDEPAASLDRESQKLLMEFIRNLPDNNTVVFTSHSAEWLALAQRSLFLEAGTIRADVPAEQITTRASKAQTPKPVWAEPVKL